MLIHPEAVVASGGHGIICRSIAGSDREKSSNQTATIRISHSFRFLIECKAIYDSRTTPLLTFRRDCSRDIWSQIEEAALLIILQSEYSQYKTNIIAPKRALRCGTRPFSAFFSSHSPGDQSARGTTGGCKSKSEEPPFSSRERELYSATL